MKRPYRPSRKTSHVPADLATTAGRARARHELLWSDHGFLRARFQNLHPVSTGMWRSNQPSPEQIAAHARQRGIRTILNLRGESPRGFYLLEREACAAYGVRLVDFRVYSRDAPTQETVIAARDLFERIEYPALMHCKSGADRAGLMSALYLILQEGAPIETARAQLSLKYLHIRQGKTGVLDAFLEAYSQFNAKTPKPFLDWVSEDYDRDAVKAEFLRGFVGRLNLDRILGRE